jgi:hypothetical protein
MKFMSRQDGNGTITSRYTIPQPALAMLGRQALVRDLAVSGSPLPWQSGRADVAIPTARDPHHIGTKKGCDRGDQQGLTSRLTCCFGYNFSSLVGRKARNDSCLTRSAYLPASPSAPDVSLSNCLSPAEQIVLTCCAKKFDTNVSTNIFMSFALASR